MAGELFLEEESDVRRYKLVFDHLRAVADSPDAARSLIAPAWRPGQGVLTAGRLFLNMV
ncbi:MAG: Scr1 family TA system antitoxin-like transcriptional regulator [Streptosporangiales bacterium]